MRKFYIFNINDEFAILNKNDAYNIYRQMQDIKKLTKKEFYNAIKIYEMLADTINKNSIEELLFNNYKYSYFYTKYKNVHMFNNYYKNEESKLIVNKAFLLLETNSLKPTFFNDLKNQNYFVCDFENKDYFWIDSLYNS